MLNQRLSLKKVVPAAAIAAVLALAVAVAPSIAGNGFLTRQKAANTYVKAKKANRVFLSKKEAGNTYFNRKKADARFLKSKEAAKTYIAQKDLYLPFAQTAASSVDFGPTNSEVPVPVPGSTTTFEAPGVKDVDDPDPGLPINSLVTLSFSGSATCTSEAAEVGTGCTVDILVDGASIGKVNLLTSSDEANKPDASVYTITQTTIVSPGEHTASFQYRGVEDQPTLKFGLKDFTLAVNGVPEPPEEE